MATYDGQIIRTEEGPEDYHCENIEHLIRIVRSLQAGDTLTINRDE